MATWISEFPFLVLLAAGGIALGCAILVRRAGGLTGGRLNWLVALLSGVGWLTLCLSFIWAWMLGPRMGASGVITSMGTYSPAAMNKGKLTALGLALTVFGWLLIAGGGALAAWAIAARARIRLYSSSAERLARRPPYSLVRRPLILGALIAGFGASWIVDTIPGWVCYGAGLGLVLLLQELDDWDLRTRLTAAAEYQASTPRFVPRVRLRRRRRS